MINPPSTTGVVIIGRNEGERLIRCLKSVSDRPGMVVYVDSGSTDGSQEAAREAGVHLVDLDSSQPFTAARARNIGLAELQSRTLPPDYVQFVDGDCELQPDWMEIARSFLDNHPKAAVACGRRRERFPQASVYNGLIDREWDTPIGEMLACGGDAMMRIDPLKTVGGFNPNLIAGEEPELCVRLRAAGWTIWRLDAEMTLHDAAITRFSQWWKRNRRAGHAFAEGASLHGAPPERHRIKHTKSALFWGACVPAMAVLGALLLTPWLLLLILIWPAQIVRLRARGEPWRRGFFLTLGKVPEAQGVLGFWFDRSRGVRVRLVEYK